MKIHRSALLLLFFLSIQGFTQLPNGAYIFPTDDQLVYGMCFSSKGYVLAIGDNSCIRIFSVGKKELLATLEGGHSGKVISLDFSKDSSMLASGGTDGTLTLWNLNTGKIWKQLTEHTGPVTTVRFSPDGQYLVSGGADHRVILYETQSGRQIRTFEEHKKDITAIEFSSDGKFFAVSGGDRKITLYSTAEAACMATLKGHRGWIRDIALSGDSKALYSCGDDGRLICWKISDLRNIRKEEVTRIGASRLLSLDLFPDNSCYVTGSQRGILRVTANQANYRARLGKVITGVKFKPNEQDKLRIAVSTMGNGVCFLNVATMKIEN